MANDINAGDSFEFHKFATTCPSCGVYSAFSSEFVSAVSNSDERGVGAIVCQHCGSRAAVIARYSSGKTFVLEGNYPFPQRGIDNQAPRSVADALYEAVICHAAGARFAGALMCRRAVQLIARDQKVPKGKLVGEITALSIPEELKVVAHSIRIFGNDAAHPDPDDWDSISTEELKEAVELVRTLIQYIYEMPVKAQGLSTALPSPDRLGSKDRRVRVRLGNLLSLLVTT